MTNVSAPEAEFVRTLSVSGPASLDIRVESGLIRIGVGAPGSVRVRGVLRASRSLLDWSDMSGRIEELGANPPVAQAGDAIRIGRLVNKSVGGRIALLLDITAPPDTAVRARAESANIQMDGVQGPVYCHTDSGEIEVANSGGGVRAEADSGRIRIFRSKGSVSAETDCGDVELLEIAGQIDARADSGAIRISQTWAAPVRARTDSGSIRIQLVATAGYDVRTRTDSGEVRVQAQIREDGPPVDVRTDSGSIEVE